MHNFLNKLQAPAYALLRVVSGFMFCFHGVQKVLGFFTESRAEFATLAWMAGLLELVCGAMILLGFKAREAAFLASGEMAVAYFAFHWKGQMGNGLFPAINHGELAALYCFVFLVIATHGSGKWALRKD